VKRFGLACALACGLIIGLSLPSSTVAHAQVCASLHAADYAPVVDKKCGQWVLQRMDRYNPRFGSVGWQIDDHGKHYILVANYNKSSGSSNFEYFQTIDRALLVDDADLRVGKARPLREDRVDAELEDNAVGLYLEQGYAEAMGMLPR
jgi:hypothetical protein